MFCPVVFLGLILVEACLAGEARVHLEQNAAVAMRILAFIKSIIDTGS
jgi:hypothetical protein